MDDRELIIDALRDYERKSEHCAKLADKAASAVTLAGGPRNTERAERERALEQTWKRRGEAALRVRAELEDNADYVVKGGAA